MMYVFSYSQGRRYIFLNACILHDWGSNLLKLEDSVQPVSHFAMETPTTFLLYKFVFD